MLKQGPCFFRAPGPVAGAGSEALRFATSPAPATEPGALRLMPFLCCVKRQARMRWVFLWRMQAKTGQPSRNAAAQAGACGGAMWQSEAPLSPVAGRCLSGGLNTDPAPCLSEQHPLQRH